jgi:hypothetical protein
MKHTLVAVSAFALVSSLSALSAAQEFDRSFVSEISEEMSEHQRACMDQVANEWSQPGIADENYTKLKLEFALNRVQNGQEAIVFHGTTFNRFLHLERKTTVTCRITDNPPYLISFRIAR